jgi:hypothetical protein
MSFGILVFLGSFILAAVTCGLAATGRLDARLALAAGALPFVLAVLAMMRLSSAAGDLPISGVGELLQLASIGMPVYFIGTGLALYGGVRILKEATPQADGISTAPEDVI